MKLESLRDLLVEQLQDLYDAENRITKALPKMAKAATSPALKAAFEKHLGETEGQVKRLEQVFEALGEKAKTKTCKAMQGLIAEGEETMRRMPSPRSSTPPSSPPPNASSTTRWPVMAPCDPTPSC